MGTILVVLILAGIVGMAVRSMIRDKKAGKSFQCGGDCKFCGGYCRQVKAAGEGETSGKEEAAGKISPGERMRFTEAGRDR